MKIPLQFTGFKSNNVAMLGQSTVSCSVLVKHKYVQIKVLIEICFLCSHLMYSQQHQHGKFITAFSFQHLAQNLSVHHCALK